MNGDERAIRKKPIMRRLPRIPCKLGGRRAGTGRSDMRGGANRKLTNPTWGQSWPTTFKKPSTSRPGKPVWGGNSGFSDSGRTIGLTTVLLPNDRDGTSRVFGGNASRCPLVESSTSVSISATCSSMAHQPTRGESTAPSLRTFRSSAPVLA